MNAPASSSPGVSCDTRQDKARLLMSAMTTSPPAFHLLVLLVLCEGGGREGGREGATAGRHHSLTEVSQPAWLVRSQLGPGRDIWRGGRELRSQDCQINILCSSLSAISVMVGNGVNFSSRKSRFCLGSCRARVFFSRQEGRVSQWGVISEEFVTFRPWLQSENPVQRCGKD